MTTANNTTKTNDIQKLLLRSLVDNIYDAQSVRIAMGNRLCASLRDLGIVSAESSEEASVAQAKAATRAKAKAKAKANADEESSENDEDKENVKIIAVLTSEYQRVADAYVQQFDSHGRITKALDYVGAQNKYITTELTYQMVSAYLSAVALEERYLKILAKEVQKHPMWDAFFSKVKGCGALMSAVCIAYFDPYKARYASSFWKYAGLDVVVDENGAHGRCNHDYVMVEYENKNGEMAERKSLGYNPFVKTKLVGVLGSAFLRAGADGQYAKVYYDYRNRLENRPDCKDLRPIVIHRRATRYAVKMFLKDMWKAWRELEGLPVGEDYAVAKLGYAPHHDPRNQVVG